ncbi:MULTISPECIES: nitroreductase family protein [Paenibacillus]|uniref:Nitroreductase family protein n=1 Tax=Paenibacillus polymyxa TaxID=1406 RepID=A0AAP3ZZV9_PAEPO|nr:MULTISPECIES: nitroreductase family protein [Paenibacillus]AHC17935.1 NAD(P)H nitroreductase [Paenibacillus polymyxa CR1]MDH2332650.1 nitroreductase family protein [Paenibacillus polymyxa]OMF76917.1 nitroreductase family protein [Paenibacillus peoriae]SFR25022.1 Nitroreductase [Paenibacillus sp. cl130]
MNQNNTSNFENAEEVIEKILRERHATKEYKTNVIIPEETLNEIFELAATAPSAWNLQHWRFLVIQNQEQKDRIKPIAYGQQQISDASAVVVILGDLEANRTGREMYNRLYESEFISKAVRDILFSQIEGGYQSPQFARDEANKNAALAAMQLMLAAKSKGYDSGPIGGFNPAGLLEALNIPGRFIPVMIVTLGVAATPARPTTRFSLNELVIHESF